MKRNRIAEIEELINKRGKLSLKKLSESFPHVSQMTLRRDLLALEKDGKLIRVRGGAMSVQDVQKASNVPYTKKTATHTNEKIQIAQKTARLIDEGTSLYLDAGTTALYLAKEMPDLRYNVFTNGLAVATELAKKNNVSVNLLGGVLIKENLSTASSLASIYFTDSNFEVAVLSAAAFTPESGFSCSTQMEADLCKLICRKAKSVYMMLDSSKIGKIKPYTFARLDDINVLITDSAFPEELKAQLKEQNVVLL
ncbi:MAG: DeoR/GlpR transcriptional regulator [Clostridia bacterium]|nr:DeoR/GlpR transcriptional regulator [Clostridia bacterium]